MMKANIRYKDSVFTKLFSDEQRLLELYNALTGSSYDSSAKIVINTLPDILFKDRKNDISFLLDDKLVVLLEHQSTINENMPLRFLIYVARLYENIVDMDNVYRQQILKIPRPEFMVLYNGVEPYPDTGILKLSDAFETVENNDAVNIELIAPVFNINAGKNIEIAKKSKALYDYSTFIAEVRENEKTRILAEAVKAAIKACVKKGILEDFLLENASEVFNMLTTEWNWDTALRVSKEEGVEIGREEGMRLGQETILELVEQGYTAAQIKEILTKGEVSQK
jgi:hypothetical protein